MFEFLRQKSKYEFTGDILVNFSGKIEIFLKVRFFA